MQARHRIGDLTAVTAFPHDLEALLGMQDAPQALPHELLVVDEQDSDHAGSTVRGSSTSTHHESPSGPARSSPPSSVTRSCIPRTPSPPSALATRVAPANRLRTCNETISSATHSDMVVRVPGACRTTFDKDSCATR